MNPVVERGAGLDVHQATVVATVRIPDTGGRTAITETFPTTTAGLLTLRDWLQAHGVTHVAMESTGVYWKPVYYILEDSFTLLLVNAHHLKQVPGRKSDVRDSEWIAQLLEWGLLRSSLVPPAPIRDLRDLTRYRKHQSRDRARSESVAPRVGRCGHQTQYGRHRCHGSVGSGDVGCVAGRDHRPGSAGQLGAGQTAQEAAGIAASLARSLSGASWLSHRPNPDQNRFSG